MPFTLREDELDEIILRAIRHGGRETLAHLQIMEKRIMSEFDDLSAQLDDVSTKEDANAAVLAQIQAAGIEIDTDIKDAISLIQQTNASVITEAQLGQIRDKLTAIQGKVAANSAAASAALTTTQADDAEWQASQAPVEVPPVEAPPVDEPPVEAPPVDAPPAEPLVSNDEPKS